jgi:acyl carrier protein
MKKMGVEKIAVETGLKVFKKMLDFRQPQVCVFPVNLAKLFQFYGHEDIPALFHSLYKTTQTNAISFQDKKPKTYDLIPTLLKATPVQQQKKLNDFICKQVCELLGLDSSQAVDTGTPLNEIGFDSLMWVELRKILESAMEQAVPVSLIYDYPTINDLSNYLIQKIVVVEVKTPPEQDHRMKNGSTGTIPDLDQLTDDELALLLEEKLDASERPKNE